MSTLNGAWSLNSESDSGWLGGSICSSWITLLSLSMSHVVFNLQKYWLWLSSYSSLGYNMWATYLSAVRNILREGMCSNETCKRYAGSFTTTTSTASDSFSIDSQHKPPSFSREMATLIWSCYNRISTWIGWTNSILQCLEKVTEYQLG